MSYFFIFILFIYVVDLSVYLYTIGELDARGGQKKALDPLEWRL